MLQNTNRIEKTMALGPIYEYTVYGNEVYELRAEICMYRYV